MFKWQEFSTLAKKAAVLANVHDNALPSILSMPEPPQASSDEVGRPLPNCARINRHPDVANLRRVIGVRRSLAIDERNEAYVKYADELLRFVGEDSLEVFVVSIVTDSNYYQFFYIPDDKRAICLPIGHLGNIQQQHM